MVASSRSRSEMLVVESVNSTANARAAAMPSTMATTALMSMNDCEKSSASCSVLVTERKRASASSSSASEAAFPSAQRTSTPLGANAPVSASMPGAPAPKAASYAEALMYT